jgi:uncharacterized protein (DUF2267 family)
MTTYDELVEAVRGQAGVDGAQAGTGLDAALEALGERLAGGAVDDLAAALPEGAAVALRRGRTAEAQPGSSTDLAERVGAATGTDATQGANLLQAALRAIAQNLDDGLLVRVRGQLPSDLARLLQRRDEGDEGAVHTGA